MVGCWGNRNRIASEMAADTGLCSSPMRDDSEAYAPRNLIPRRRLEARRARWLIAGWCAGAIGLAALLALFSAPTRLALRTSLLVPHLLGIHGPLVELGSSAPVHAEVTLPPVFGAAVP